MHIVQQLIHGECVQALSGIMQMQVRARQGGDLGGNVHAHLQLADLASSLTGTEHDAERRSSQAEASEIIMEA